MRFLATNLVTESATDVTASTSNSNFPVSNLKNPLRSKRWRSTDENDQWVKFDLQTSENINSVVLLWPKEDGIRLSDSVVITVQANATDVWTSPSVSQTLTVDDTYLVASHFFSSNQSYRYWRITIDDPGNPDEYVELGMVWLGTNVSFNEPENGFKPLIEDQSVITKNAFGHEYVDEYPLITSLDFDFKYIQYATYQALENAYRENGNKKPVIVVFDEAGTVLNKNHFLIYGKLGKSFSSNHVMYDMFNGGLKITELG